MDHDLGGGQYREDVAHAAHPAGEEQQNGEQERGRCEETAGGGGFGGPGVVPAVGEPCGRAGQEGRTQRVEWAVGGSHVIEPRQSLVGAHGPVSEGGGPCRGWMWAAGWPRTRRPVPSCQLAGANSIRM